MTVFARTILYLHMHMHPLRETAALGIWGFGAQGRLRSAHTLLPADFPPFCLWLGPRPGTLPAQPHADSACTCLSYSNWTNNTIINQSMHVFLTPQYWLSLKICGGRGFPVAGLDSSGTFSLIHFLLASLAAMSHSSYSILLAARKPITSCCCFLICVLWR